MIGDCWKMLYIMFSSEFNRNERSHVEQMCPAYLTVSSCIFTEFMDSVYCEIYNCDLHMNSL